MNNVSECPVCGTGVGVPHLHGCDFASEFPGWLPEHGETRFGYPLPPDFGISSANQVRSWGKKALDVLAQSIMCEEAGDDPDWIIDARRWSEMVLSAVSENIDTEDAELRAYEKKLEDSLAINSQPKS